MMSRPRSIRARSAPSLGSRPMHRWSLFAGRLAEQKRVEDLLKAVDLLQHVQPDFAPLIVGDGPLRGRLEETAHRIISMAGSGSWAIATTCRG